MTEDASQQSSVVVTGVGAYKPKKVLTNDDLSKIVETSDEWIQTRTGIRARHIAEKDESCADMSTRAARQAIERAQVTAEDIDLIIVATITPDRHFPAVACEVQRQLGCREIPAFDISAACSGFPYALEIARGMIQGGPYKHALIIGAEKLSGTLDWDDRTTCVLFGDGAGAVILKEIDQKGEGILHSRIGGNGEHADILCQNKGEFLKMTGKEVYKLAVKHMEEVALDLMERAELTVSDIQWVIPHQANIRILEAVAKRLSIPMDTVILNLERVGNTSAASIPLALNDAFEAGKFKKGDQILLLAFGAGLTWGATLLKWY